MAEVTYFVALPFFASDGGVAAGEPTECFNPNAAVMRAEAFHAGKTDCKGCYHFCYPTAEYRAGLVGISGFEAYPRTEQDQSLRDEGSLLGTVPSELQNRVHQFNSGRGLHQYNQQLVLII
jgi:hypothetical protein